jgi:hypothetical protein
MMKADRLRAALGAALAIAALLAPARCGFAMAQQPARANDYAVIFGTVWDSNDRPAYGIPVKIRRAGQKKAKWELISDHHGEFAQRVPAGTADYVVWADSRRSKMQKIEKKVHIENNEQVDISLHLTE